MLKKKKLFAVCLMISVYALLLSQEIVLSQVLCHKENNRVSLEVAVFDFYCDCKKVHDHPDSSTFDSRQCSALSCQYQSGYSDCYDLPIDCSWLERDVPDDCVSAPALLQQYDLTLQKYFLVNELFRQLNEAVPLSKFLYNPPYQNHGVVLRC